MKREMRKSEREKKRENEKGKRDKEKKGNREKGKRENHKANVIESSSQLEIFNLWIVFGKHGIWKSVDFCL